MQADGIEDFVFHDLRHIFDTEVQEAGVDRAVIMDITDHGTAGMLVWYDMVDE